MYQIDPSIREAVMQTHGIYIEGISRVPKEKIVSDVLDGRKPQEQIALLGRYLSGQELKGLKLLEIGSGYGIFNLVARQEFGIDAWGVEPDSSGFGGSLRLSKELLANNGLDAGCIVAAGGESLPFEDNSFDVVYSTNVLEHVSDPVQVINEAIRVCRPGGVIQIVVPNYGSFFDGHYACWYLPYQPKWFWKWYLKNILHRDPGFADTLRISINYFYLKKVLSPFVVSGKVQTLGYGEDVFKERMVHLNFTPWAGLTKISKILQLMHKLRITGLVTWAMILIKAYNPIILTIKKLK